MKKYLLIPFVAMFLCSVLVQSQEVDEEQSHERQESELESELQKRYKAQLDEVVKDVVIKNKDDENPMVQRAKSAYKEYENSDIASVFFDSVKEKADDEEINESSVLIFFFSSSMPERTIRAYMIQAEKINNRILFVMRGPVDNSLKLLPTIKYIQELKTFEGCGEALCQRPINTIIDPRLFEQYGITEVPALAYSGEFSNFGYFENQALPKKDHHTVIVGEATLPYLVKTLSEELNDESLTAIAQKYSF